MSSPALSGLTTVTFSENTVNTTPQLLDSSVTLSDSDNDFNGGQLTVAGLLAEDTVAIQAGATIFVTAERSSMTPTVQAAAARSPSAR